MLIKEVITPLAAKSKSPLSQGIVAGTLLFVSGQLPVHPERGTVPERFEDQARQALDNLRAVVEAGGSSLDRVVRVGVYLVDIRTKVAFNEVYRTYFREPYPARTVVEVNSLEEGIQVEVEAVALLPQ